MDRLTLHKHVETLVIGDGGDEMHRQFEGVF